MHIHWDMFGYANAGWEPQSMQSGAMAQAGAGCDADGDADGSAGGANATSGAGANPILQALAQALESLGVSLESNSAPSGTPAAATAATTSGTAAPVTDPAPSTASTTAAAKPASSSTQPAAQSTSTGDGSIDFHEIHAIARDIRHVMRALFTDIQAENTLAPASSGSPSTAQSSFGSGLAALISQIQGGSVPANLANAFDKLVSDLEKIGGSSGANGAPVSTSQESGAAAATAPTTTTATTATSTAPSAVASSAGATASTQSTSGAGGLSYQGLLLQFLTNLQSDLGLGYGTSSSSTAQGATSGIMVNTLA